MAEPPSDAGEKATESCPFPGVIPVMDGALGIAIGDPATDGVGNPSPFALTARICNRYTAPFVSPVITNGLAVDAGERVVKVVPPSVENL